MYFNVEIYNVEQRRINVVYFNVDINNFIQHRNNIVIFNVEFQKVGWCQNNVVKIIISRKNKKKKSFQIKYMEFKVLTAISYSSSLYSPC